MERSEMIICEAHSAEGTVHGPVFIKQSFREWANETTKHSLWASAFYIQASERGIQLSAFE
jgi:hypothetical protein